MTSRPSSRSVASLPNHIGRRQDSCDQGEVTSYNRCQRATLSFSSRFIGNNTLLRAPQVSTAVSGLVDQVTLDAAEEE